MQSLFFMTCVKLDKDKANERLLNGNSERSLEVSELDYIIMPCNKYGRSTWLKHQLFPLLEWCYTHNSRQFAHWGGKVNVVKHWYSKVKSVKVVPYRNFSSSPLQSKSIAITFKWLLQWGLQIGISWKYSVTKIWNSHYTRGNSC